MNRVDENSSQLALGPGTVVAGKYRIERTLAEGGMGLVVAATHLHLGRYVALKFLRDRGDVSSQWDALARFSLEAKTVAKLRSEHVAHVLDAGVTDDGTPYMVMEYLEGRSLARTIQASGPLDVATAVEYAIQACEGLAEAHAHGIVHRDIKPYNLFLIERSPGWHAIKIVDFGISKFAFADTSNVVTGVIIGTPCYMSPEQLRSTATVDHRSDIWSLGATLYELLAGRAAFDSSQTLPELVTAILENPAPALRELRPDVPEELAAVVTRCLAKDREKRFRSAGEMAMALLPFAPPRAHVPAERAAEMRPAFPMAEPEMDFARTIPAPAADSSLEADAKTPSHQAANGPSLLPVTMPAAELAAPTPQALATGPDLEQAEKSAEPADEMPRFRGPRWLGPTTLGAGAALLFFLILFAPPEGGSKASPAARPAPQSVAVPAAARPEAPPLPTATLAPLDAPAPLEPRTPGPEPVERTARAAPASPQVPVDTTSVTTSAAGTTSRNRAPATPAPPAHALRHLAAQAPAFVGQSTPQTPIASSGGEVDPMGGRIPLRPIETRDPYGSP